MTEPATDDEIADMAAGSSNHLPGNDYPAICVDKLIARIKVEREARKQAEDDADLFHDEMEKQRIILEDRLKTMRVTTVLECMGYLEDEGDGAAASSLSALLDKS